MNKVILLGNVCKDPELKYTQTNNKPVCTFSVAVNREFGEGTDFFTIQAWNNTAEFISKYFKKGSRIALVGRLQNRTWTDNEGKNHNVTEIVVESVDFAEKKIHEENSTINIIPEENQENYDDDLPF